MKTHTAGAMVLGLWLAALTGCGSSATHPSPSPSSLCGDSTRALAVARKNAPSSTPETVISMTCTHFRDVNPGSTVVSPDTLVWSFVFGGTFGICSGGGPLMPSQTARPCPPATTERIVVDTKGNFVMGGVPAR